MRTQRYLSRVIIQLGAIAFMTHRFLCNLLLSLILKLTKTKVIRILIPLHVFLEIKMLDYCFLLEKYDEAEVYLQEQINHYLNYDENTNVMGIISRYYKDLAILYIAKKDYDTAMRIIDKAQYSSNADFLSDCISKNEMSTSESLDPASYYELCSVKALCLARVGKCEEAADLLDYLENSGYADRCTITANRHLSSSLGASRPNHLMLKYSYRLYKWAFVLLIVTPVWFSAYRYGLLPRVSLVEFITRVADAGPYRLSIPGVLAATSAYVSRKSKCTAILWLSMLFFLVFIYELYDYMV